MSNVRIIKRESVSIFAFLILFCIAGCNAPQGHLQSFNNYFTMSDYEGSAAFAQSKIKPRENPSGEDLLWTMQLASVERVRKNYEQSTAWFDRCEEMLKYYDEQSKLGDGVSATMINDNAVAYKGEEYDGVMINTYKGLNFMAEGKMDLARVEFNRALDRQRRAKEKFAEEIQKLESELEKKQAAGDKTVKSNVENEETFRLLEEKYPNLHRFEAYPDFVNPFTTYLSAVFFNLAGDHSKAEFLLKESCGMVNDNVYLVQDLAETEAVLTGKGRLRDTVWLIYENGLGPVKEEFRIDIPLFLATDRIKYIGIALPRLQVRDGAFPYLIAEVDGKSYNTAVVADMDRVVQAEFSKDYKAILTRAIISATAKAVSQYALENQNSTAGSLFSAMATVYSLATTAADVRIWTTLPKNFQVARFGKPASGKFTITPAGSVPFEIDVNDCNNAIVYVRIPTKQALPICEVIRF